MEMTSSVQKSAAGKRYLLLFVLLTLGVLAGGAWLYRVQVRQLREMAENELATVAKFKVNQIAAWRAERLGDAAGISTGPFFAAAVEQRLRAPSSELARGLRERFKGLQQSWHYEEVALVDVEGRKLLSLSGTLNPLVEEETQSLKEALANGKPALSHICRHPEDAVLHTVVVAPIRVGEEGEAGKLLGALVLVVNVDDFLYPLIQSWPTASRSAETLLVEREGGQVVFLNELRHRKGAPLSLKISISQTNVPAVMASLGHKGLFEGIDYRGVPVVSYLGQIPDSPWFMVSKVDKAEAFAMMRSQSVMLLVLMALLVAMMLALGAMFWQRAQKYRLAYEAERERQRMEKSLHARDESHRLELHAKDKLLSHVSHELRTPIAVIHQFSTILSDGLAGQTTRDQQHYLQIILANVSQLQAMINDLLEAVRSGTGKLAIETEVVALVTLIPEVIKSFAHAADVHRLTLRAEITPGLSSVWADPRRVRQILGNLIDNAIKFTPAHGRITVRAALADTEEGFVRVSVADTGIGIALEQQAKVFDRLYQVEGTNPVSRKGLGLGLHIGKELVELHGGRIWIESSLDKGTTVHFTLPTQPKEANHAQT